MGKAAGCPDTRWFARSCHGRDAGWNPKGFRHFRAGGGSPSGSALPRDPPGVETEAPETGSPQPWTPSPPPSMATIRPCSSDPGHQIRSRQSAKNQRKSARRRLAACSRRCGVAAAACVRCVAARRNPAGRGRPGTWRRFPARGRRRRRKPCRWRLVRRASQRGRRRRQSLVRGRLRAC